MKVEFTLHQKKVDSVFKLLGDKEDDMTYSFGWGLRSSPTLLLNFLKSLGLPKSVLTNASVRISLQEHKHKTNGFTDIEITVMGNKTAHIIVEAKRGWVHVTQEQIEKYVRASEEDEAERDYKIAVLLTNFDEKRMKDLDLHQEKVRGYEVKYTSWESILRMAKKANSSTRGHHEKWVLNDLINYLKGIVVMRDIKSNMVYSCVVNNDNFGGTDITFRDVVKKGFYFHPIGNGYAHIPHNYLAFRYNGKTEAIYFAKKVTEFTNYRQAFADMKWDVGQVNEERVDPHFLYHLDKPIVLNEPLKSDANYRAVKFSVMLDTMLTSSTLKEAKERTNKRLDGVT